MILSARTVAGVFREEDRYKVEVEKVSWMDNLRNMFSGEGEGGAARFRSRLAMLLLLGVGLILFNTVFTFGNKKVEDVAPLPSNPALEDNFQAQKERELAEMLNQIYGVSNAKVLISMEDMGRIEVVTDREQSDRITREEDSGGGKREVNEVTLRETHVIVRDLQGQETPLVVQERAPRYRGVLVIADGVGKPEVQALVIDALRSTLDLPHHRITVLPRG